ncbi:TetR/AcrR family transcriptional regulator [Nocardioides sp. zg-536]|uniref:TetR/AcrR family transcriptional regulator n=1 Tax=Nocardioides faecalis TaxID=2803858 RepID=A0A938Y3H4_9ACTN|nr:TetR/AcrR family transcriptional regulator [Nocardioides faecalis]QVI57849.1 TetR/AcrR family transcriptional regulator [Nocardioides faecalis]
MVPVPLTPSAPRPVIRTGLCRDPGLPASSVRDVASQQLNSDENPARGVRLPRRERRAQLLSAALEVFVAQGYHAAAMDDIAERAGVSKPVLYQHFPGKLELYLAILDAACDSIIASCRAALESTHDNKRRVAAAIDAFYAYVAHDTGAFRLVFESDLTSEQAVRDHVDRVTAECADMIAAVIRDDAGLPAPAARLLAVSLVGMGQVSARFWLADTDNGASGLTREEAAALVSGLAWRGIRGYPLSDEHADG